MSTILDILSLWLKFLDIIFKKDHKFKNIFLIFLDIIYNIGPCRPNFSFLVYVEKVCTGIILREAHFVRIAQSGPMSSIFLKVLHSCKKTHLISSKLISLQQS